MDALRQWCVGTCLISISECMACDGICISMQGIVDLLAASVDGAFARLEVRRISQGRLGGFHVGLFEPGNIGQPRLVKGRDVSSVDRRRDGLEEGERTFRIGPNAYALTSSSYTIAGTFLLINTLEGWILTCWDD